MLESLRALNYGISSIFDGGDPRLKDWPLMQNPLPGCVMIAAYVYFVKRAGPQYMKMKPPFDLTSLMLVYNFTMVFVNAWLFLEIGWYGWFTEYKFVCQNVDYSNNYGPVRMAQLGWWLYILKFVEFMDTIFFVLRKKGSQISNLHVIHHSIVPFSYWFGMKYAPGGYNSFFPFLNCLVHVIMYFYYGLAAMGPNFKKYLFWKMYITYIQMAQFIIVFVFGLTQIFAGCEFSKVFIVLHIMHALLFLGLFYNFFKHSYSANTRKRDSSVTLPNKQNGNLCPVQHVTCTTQSNKSNDTSLRRKYSSLAKS